MKSAGACRRRRRCAAGLKIAAYCYAIVMIIVLCQVQSFRYKEKRYTLILPSIHTSIDCIRGGSSSSIHNIDLTIPSDVLDSIDERPLWKRIRLLRGGVEDDEKIDVNQDGGAEVRDGDDTNNSSCINVEDDGKLNNGKEGGAFTSFFSLFRSPEKKANAYIERVATDTSNIAHKMPHGPDGRGGGGRMTTLPPPISSAEDSRKDQDKGDEDILITAEFTELVAARSPPSDNKDDPSVPPEEDIKPPSAKAGGNSATAFVVPPSPNSNKPQVEEKKKSKSSKIKEVVEDTDTTATPLPNSTNNETEVVAAALNITLDSNVTVPVSSNTSSVVTEGNPGGTEIDYTSSGYWVGIDLITSLGLSSLSDDLKISKALRPMRKSISKATGLHGFLSGKLYMTNQPSLDISDNKTTVEISIDEELGIHDPSAVEAEMLARRVHANRIRNKRGRGNNNRQGRRWGFRRGQQGEIHDGNKVIRSNMVNSDYVVVSALDTSPDALAERRRKRAEEIDRLLQRGGERLLELQCERDDLLCAPNPLFNYTKKYDPSTNHTFGDVRTTREFNFPPPDLVNEYSELKSACHCLTME